jgi:putative MATE family efflux protein
VLAPCLVFGLGPFPELGVTGAAVATNLGRGTAVLYQVWKLVRHTPRLSIRREHLVLHPATMGALLRVAASGSVQILIATASWVGLVRILTSFGSAAVAGYTIGMRVIVFALMPCFGMANAAATLVGQSLGANKPERAERSVWIAAGYNMVFLGVVGVIFVIFAGPIAGVFTTDPVVKGYAESCLRVVSYGFLFYAAGMVLEQAFNGAGDTWTPTVLNFFCFWVFEIPMAWALAKPMGIGPLGVFVSVALGFSVLAVLAAIMFRRGRWKLKKI